jgi:membrane fusion protein (multidrug efflux system)
MILGAWLSVAMAAGLAGCGHGTSEPQAQAASSTPRAIPVTVSPLERRAIERTVDVIGTLRGWEQVTIGSKRAGRVIKVLHDMGDRIEPGEPLVELEPVDARLAMDEAESKYLGALARLGVTRKQAEESVRTYGISEDLLNNRATDEAIARSPAVVEKRVAREKAQQSLARQRTLTQRGAGTAQELEDAESAYRTAVAAYDNAEVIARTTIADAYAARTALNKAEQSLRDMTIRAPQPTHRPPKITSAGRIQYAMTRRQASEGQILKEGEAVVDLVIEDPLRLWTQVPEQYIDAVRVGQLVRISTRAHAEMTFEGQVTRISPSVDPTSRTFQVETLIPNKRGLLRPGGLARASIITDAQAKAAVVPMEAIVRYAGVTKIFVVQGGQARAIDDIQTGAEGRGWVEVISSHLPPTADVVTTGQTQLADGTPVVVRRPEEVREARAGSDRETPR